MFGRFREPARQVVVFAQEEARSLRHGYIGTEHILLGLNRENEGIAARILLGFDVDQEKIRKEIIWRLETDKSRRSANIPGPPPISPSALAWPLASRRSSRATRTCSRL